MATIILAYANFFVNEEIGYVSKVKDLNRRDIKKDK